MNNELLEIFKLYLQNNILENKNRAIDEDSFAYKIAHAALDNKKTVKIGDKIYPVDMTKEKAHRIINEKESNLQKINEKNKKLSKKQQKIAQAAPPPDKITADDFKALNKQKDISEEKEATKYPAQYKAYGKRKKDLDRCTALYDKGDIKGAAKCRQKMEKPHMKESMKISSNVLSILANDAIEEHKLDNLLNEIEEKLEEKRKKRKKRKKKGKSPKGLSKAVKKSLDKKADKRCLTRGSVYSEFRKGLAAFLSSGSRKGMSAHQWAHARVNSAQPSKSWASVKKRKTCAKKKK